VRERYVEREHHPARTGITGRALAHAIHRIGHADPRIRIGHHRLAVQRHRERGAEFLTFVETGCECIADRQKALVTMTMNLHRAPPSLNKSPEC